MVTKRQSTKKQIKVGKLKLNKETVKDLTRLQAKGIKGGLGGQPQTKTVAPPTNQASMCRAGAC
jgi:hypothetical protein